jgi:hypothetical protein
MNELGAEKAGQGLDDFKMFVDNTTIMEKFGGCDKFEDEESLFSNYLKKAWKCYDELKYEKQHSRKFKLPVKMLYHMVFYDSKKVFIGKFEGVFYDKSQTVLRAVFEDLNHNYQIISEPIIICKTPNLQRGVTYRIEWVGKLYNSKELLYLFNIKRLKQTAAGL